MYYRRWQTLSFGCFEMQQLYSLQVLPKQLHTKKTIENKLLLLLLIIDSPSFLVQQIKVKQDQAKKRKVFEVMQKT